MKLNQTVSYDINGAAGTNISRNGYLLLGQSNNFIGSGTPIYNTGAFSLLHLNGYGTSGIDELGYRNWMQTGITLTGNRDLSYFGLRQVGEGEDITETTIAWADDGTSSLGPDDLVFRFLGGNPSATTISSDFTSQSDLDGVNIARFTPSGQIGFGNTFGLTTDHANYVRPQNLLHMSLDGNKAVYLQITNELGTGQTATDGLHIGYAATDANNRIAQINQQENDRLSLYSNNGERVRITQIGALNNGVAFNPGGLTTNLTRIGISHNPATPVTRPLSLLHLGYDVANSSSNDGWRSWMDVGMFASQNSDHVYLGLDTASSGADAVLAWGDNPINDGSGPDNFKMVFTAPLLATPLYPASTQSGVEGLRMTPSLQSIFTGIGGDAANGNPYHGSSANPTATLEVNAWGSTNGNSGLRFTDLNSAATPIPNPGDGVLAVNTNGDVVYVEANNAPAIGNYCGNTPKPLTDDFEIPLNGYTYNFKAGNNDNSSVNIGNISCGLNFPARLYVEQSEPMPNSSVHAAIMGVTESNLLPAFAPSFGIVGLISQAKGLFHAGVYGSSVNADNDMFTPTTFGYGVWGTAAQNTVNVGVFGVTEDNDADLNFGIWGRAHNGVANYAIYGEVA